MKRLYLVQDEKGERQLDEQAFPLSLGGADVADIVMPGVSDDLLVAFIALADGHAYVQAAAEALPVFHNRQRLDGSRWLKSGDEVQLEDAVMNWTVQGDLVIIKTCSQPLAASVTPPAPAPVPELVPPRQAIPDVSTTTTVPAVHRTRRWLLLGVFILLLLVSAFVLLATPVEIEVTPVPDEQSVQGFPPVITLGGRRLALPGRYTVQASLAGYRDLETAIEVERGGLQRFTLQLEELPGRVRLLLQPAVDYRVFIDAEELQTGDDGVTEIDSGSHQLRIETERYLPVQVQVEISGRGQEQQFEFELQPAWADVTIDSQPPGAEVRVDDEAQGVTPLSIEVMAGERRLEITMDKYKPVILQQTITAGTVLQLDDITLTPADGQLSIDSQPAAATISVAGVFYGTTPATLTLSSGEPHDIRLSRPGYRQVSKVVTLEPEESRQLDISLPAEYGVVFVTARPADAELKIDGKPSGEATRRLRLTTRAHTLSFSKPGYVSQQVTVTPRAGVSRNIEVNLKTKTQAVAEKKAARTPAVFTTAAGQRLRLVRPAGSFTMGASRREAGRRANESSRLVQLQRPFYLSEKEVTNAEYRRFKSAHSSGSAEGVSLDADALPVVNVSWDDAARYCNWLSKQDGLPAAYRENNGRMQLIKPVTTGYRLPTEAEWAYAARKLGRQATSRYAWTGKYPPVNKAGNFADASIADTLANTVPDYNDGFRGPAPVGSFSANPGGFYDLGGNVAEWTTDYYAVYPGMATTLVTDPSGPDSGEHHVVRDSSWRQGSIAELRLSFRDYSREPRPDLGFRIARYAEY